MLLRASFERWIASELRHVQHHYYADLSVQRQSKWSCTDELVPSRHASTPPFHTCRRLYKCADTSSILFPPHQSTRTSCPANISHTAMACKAVDYRRLYHRQSECHDLLPSHISARYCTTRNRESLNNADYGNRFQIGTFYFPLFRRLVDLRRKASSSSVVYLQSVFAVWSRY